MSVKKLTEIREIRCIYTDAGRLLVQVKEKLRLNGGVWLDSRLRNWSSDGAVTTVSGRWFHRQMALGMNECWYTSILQYGVGGSLILME